MASCLPTTFSVRQAHRAIIQLTSFLGRAVFGFHRVQELTLSDSAGTIHSQEFHCYPACGGQSKNFLIPHLKVIFPAIQAWMKQGRQLPAYWIKRSDVATLEPIADGTTKGQVFSNLLTAMFRCDHMINFVFRKREFF
jgi:hypothetical protein